MSTGDSKTHVGKPDDSFPSYPKSVLSNLF